MTRLRTHNRRAKRSLLPRVPWLFRVQPRYPARKLTLQKLLDAKALLSRKPVFIGMDLGTEPATVYYLPHWNDQ